jgi:hypothetical protein
MDGCVEELTSHELEGLGLDGLIGVGFGNSTHVDEISQYTRRAEVGCVGVGVE